ncbi:hypothetical protein AB0C38_14745 [Amycolatopsis sp. NPDC048633]|uniref:hypothetical protein n=1 Tax=Amycolatopsis sp. NPDC048633 TaxID=3157095 RepID=UPI0033C633EF
MTGEPDVDSFGMLEPLPAASPLASQQVRAAALALTVPSVAGRENATAGRDLSILRIENYYARGEALEWGSRAQTRPRRGRGLQDREALRQLADKYVGPPGLLPEQAAEGTRTAFEILRDERLLVLSAPEADAGQFAAGLRLGYELQRNDPDLVVREELIDEDFQLRAEDMLSVHERAVVLVDMRGPGGELQQVQWALVEFARELEQHRSYLILIVPHDQIRKFGERLPGRVHELGKPSSVEVFTRYLTVLDAAGLATAETQVRLERMWPPQVKELAETVERRAGRGEDPAEALRDSLLGQKIDLRGEIGKHQEAGDSEWLALLLAVAVLEGSAPEHIVNAADAMLKKNKLKVEERVPLLRPSPYARLRHLDIEPFDAETREFQQPGFGFDVLQHFWREHRGLHDSMLSWIGEIPRKFADLTGEDLERIADRSAELAVGAGYQIALKLAEQWTAKGSEGTTSLQTSESRYRRSIAVRLLMTTATDTSLGPPIRNRLLSWSKGANIDLQLLTAEVCGELGTEFPRIALTRLKHLAGSEHEEVRDAVRTAVHGIGANLGGARFLRYLSEWFDEATPARLQLLSSSASFVLKEQLDDLDADTTSSFWNQALDKLPPEDLRPVVRTWIYTAAAAPAERRPLMVEPLVQATRFEPRRIAQLQFASRIQGIPLGPLGNHPVDEVLFQLWTRLDEVDPILQAE